MKSLCLKTRENRRGHKLECLQGSGNYYELRNRTVRDKMRGERVMVNCLFKKGRGCLALTGSCHFVSLRMPDLQLFQWKPENLLQIYQYVSVASFFNSVQAKWNTSVSVCGLSGPPTLHSPHRQNDFLNIQIRWLKILPCLPPSPGIKLSLTNFMAYMICLIPTRPDTFSLGQDAVFADSES